MVGTSVTAIVSVADDGGSSGRLRELLGVPALGDLRKCLVALASPGSSLAVAMEHRYAAGELAGHALGNLVLAAMVEAEGGLVAGIHEVGRLLGAVGTVLPATEQEVRLLASGPDGTTVGQVAISRAQHVEHLRIEPSTATPPAAALAAIAEADLVVIGPGSLFTSVLAAVAVPAITEALSATAATKVYVCNLRPQEPETAGYSVADHVAALERHGIDVDLCLCDSSGGLEMGVVGVPVVVKDLAGPNGLVHDPARLAAALDSIESRHSTGCGDEEKGRP
jgi:uncharacterized cofD-like protein